MPLPTEHSQLIVTCASPPACRTFPPTPAPLLSSAQAAANSCTGLFPWPPAFSLRTTSAYFAARPRSARFPAASGERPTPNAPSGVPRYAGLGAAPAPGSGRGAYGDMAPPGEGPGVRAVLVE